MIDIPKFVTAEDIMGLGNYIKGLGKEIALEIANELKEDLQNQFDKMPPRPPGRAREMPVEHGTFRGQASIFVQGDVITVNIPVSGNVGRQEQWAPQPGTSWSGEITTYTRPQSGESKAMGVKEKCSTNKFTFVVTEMVKIGDQDIVFTDQDEDSTTSDKGSETPTTDEGGWAGISDEEIEETLSNVDWDNILNRVVDRYAEGFRRKFGQ